LYKNIEIRVSAGIELYFSMPP